MPESVCVTGDLDVAAGVVEVGGDEEDGFDIDTQPADGTNATPRLVLDGEVDLGHLWIVNDDDIDIEDDHRPRPVQGPRRRRSRGDAGCDGGGLRSDEPDRPAKEGK